MANKPKNIAYLDKFASQKTQEIQRRERNDLADILDFWIIQYLQLVVGFRSKAVNWKIAFAFRLAKVTEMDNFEPERRPDLHSQYYTQRYSNLSRSSSHNM